MDQHLIPKEVLVSGLMLLVSSKCARGEPLNQDTSVSTFVLVLVDVGDLRLGSDPAGRRHVEHAVQVRQVNLTCDEVQVS